jgi:alpha-ribazole phosphatase
LSEFNVYLLRHGELVQTGILCGHTDIALSDVGKQQLIDATNKLTNISQCFSSPLIRCRTFAQEYCQQNALSLQVSTQLQEMNFGDWDGKSYQTLWQTQTSLDEKTASLGAFWQNPWQCLPPNGESMASFTERVDDFWQRLLSQLSQTHPEKSDLSNTLVFSHGGVIRYLLAKILGLPIPGTRHMTHLDVPYGALIHIQVFIDSDGKAWPKLML